MSVKLLIHWKKKKKKMMVLDGCPWLIGVLFLMSCQGAVGTNNYLFGCKTNIWATVVNPEMHIQKSRFQTDDKNDKKKKKKHSVARKPCRLYPMTWYILQIFMTSFNNCLKHVTVMALFLILKGCWSVAHEADFSLYCGSLLYGLSTVTQWRKAANHFFHSSSCPTIDGPWTEK